MAAVTAPSLSLQAEWLPAAGVSTPELAATWCSLRITAGGRPVSLVEDLRGGGIRRSVHVSAYPLALWLAANWFLLSEHVRPSETPVRGWSWRTRRSLSWLEHHNARAARDGMPWPDLTLVPEGAVCRAVWRRKVAEPGELVSFISEGDVYLPAGDVRRSLTDFVVSVLDRLGEAGIGGTPLQKEWNALAALDPEERAFARAVARLGVDPFSVEEDLASAVERTAIDIEGDLRDEFFDSVEPESIDDGADWLRRARASSWSAFERPGLAVPVPHAADDRPWAQGYAVARAYRSQLGLGPLAVASIVDEVRTTTVEGPTGGLQGLVHRSSDAIGVSLPEEMPGRAGLRFLKARALGTTLMSGRREVLLDPTGTDLARATRAFAAEMLAPAAGIAEYLSTFRLVNDAALEAVAGRFGVSPVLIQRQYENQVLGPG